VVGLAATAAFFFPGYMNGDSSWQYVQAQTGVYSDWHPVVMSWWWSGLDRLVEGSGGLFLFHAVLFWAGLVVSLTALVRGVAPVLVLTAMLGLFSPVFGMLSQVHKDTGMGAALLLGYGLLAHADLRRSGRWLLAATLPVWYALAIRHNALSAVLPFALWMGILVARDHLPRCAGGASGAGPRVWPRGVAIGLGVFALMIGLWQGATELILGSRGERVAMSQFLYVYDVVGISVRTDPNYMPTVYHPDARPLDLEELEAIYHPHSNYFLFWGPEGPDAPRRLARPGKTWIETLSEAEQEVLREAWLRAVREEPVAYLVHRVENFAAHLGLLPRTPLHTISLNVGQHLPYRGPRVFGMPHNEWMVDYLHSESKRPFFKPWPYLVLCLGAFGLLAWRRAPELRLSAPLAASVLCYVPPYLLVGGGSCFRYMWWPILTALLQAVLLYAHFSGSGTLQEESPPEASAPAR